MDRIFIRQLQTEAVIGVHDWERKIRQALLIDLEIWWDCSAAGASDKLEHTLDYAAVSQRIIRFVSDSRFQLIEALAEACARIMLEEFSAPRVRITVRKPGAVAQAQDLGVTIERATDSGA